MLNIVMADIYRLTKGKSTWVFLGVSTLIFVMAMTLSGISIVPSRFKLILVSGLSVVSIGISVISLIRVYCDDVSSGSIHHLFAKMPNKIFYLIAKKPLWDQKGTRFAATILFIFTGLLALLAGWKLFGIYIYLYGPTPLRLISAWFILVLLVWCLLTLIRFYKPIQAIRIGIFYALISFTLLCYLYPMLLPVAK